MNLIHICQHLDQVVFYFNYFEKVANANEGDFILVIKRIHSHL